MTLRTRIVTLVIAAAAAVTAAPGETPPAAPKPGFPVRPAPDQPAPGRAAERLPPIVISPGTPLLVRLNHSISTADHRAGDSFTATLVQPVSVGGTVVLPRGAQVGGHIVDEVQPGRLRGQGRLTLALDTVHAGGRDLRVNTSAHTSVGRRHKKRNWVLIGGGSATGALIGGLAGGPVGMGIGAGAGAAAGTAGAFITGRKPIRLPAETPLTFTLRSSVSVPVVTANLTRQRS